MKEKAQQNVAEKEERAQAKKRGAVPSASKAKKARKEAAEPAPRPLTHEEEVLGKAAPLLDWKIRKKRLIKDLKPGIFCTSHLIDVTGEGQFVLRVSRPDATDMRNLVGFKRDSEYAFANTFGRNSLSPPTDHHLKETDTFIMKWLEGFTVWNEEKVRENYRIVVQFVKKIHQLPLTDISTSVNLVPFNPFECCEQCLQACKNQQIALPDNIDDLFVVLKKWCNLLVAAPSPSDSKYCLCHNELSGKKLLFKPIKDGHIIKCVDFECASLGDKYYDLANLSRLNQFTDDDDVLLLKWYFDKFDDKQMVRMQLLKAVADLVEAMRIFALTKFVADPEKVKAQEEKQAAKEKKAEPTEAEANQPEEEEEEDDVGATLPDALYDRVLHCYSEFESKACSEEFSAYLEKGLMGKT
eukprot:TRINITY_DN65677_c3_g8_i1.p1 TRINITY_DN65677_c3_g8~~TRINITY_DN65677_c3_g8_i1.p1  ORF type:complete len:434 (-),score=54.92 TRINITY_DN65677_c3_g8_i1:63-1295(-)